MHDIISQYEEGAITATEMLNWIIARLGPEETQEFFNQLDVKG